MGISGARWWDLIQSGFGYTVNEAVVEVTKQMEIYHRNWEEFADEE